MKKLRSTVSIIAVCALSHWAYAQQAASAGELTAAKRADIKTLLEVTGIRAIPDQLATSSVQSMVGGVRQLDPKFPDKGFVVMRDAMKTVLDKKVDVAGGLIEQVTLVYHNAFTAAEIAEMVKFYQSPVGKKLTGLQSRVNSETIQTAMRWADSLAVESDNAMDTALKKENIKLPDPPKQEAAPKAPTAPRAPAKPAEAPPAKK
jgi:uncharacterized protein